ncbi:ring finger protein 128 [Phyllostomus discolor]|uniref:Ring finger protein 128 n=1 Tax=Phyllostomus discolor TaxID=89673 RepID=A0A834DPR1_9CHIR|nr:ring finger protein 128 [Phyllostomus discolor]
MLVTRKRISRCPRSQGTGEAQCKSLGWPSSSAEGAAPSQTRSIWLMREGHLEPSSLTSLGPAMRSSQCLTRRQLKADAKKAIGRLQLRTLKQGDKEIGPDGDSCAVCIELYKPNDLVRILTCNHIFHKTCVDPWLLEHRTCPMCKCDILKALGIEVDVEDGSVSLQVPVSNEISNSVSPPEEDNRSETASSGYASVQGADEPPLEEHVLSANENLQLVNHEACSMTVDVVPHVDNPTFEEDETPDQETVVREIKS